jgi:phosphatidate phosphatase PAH1
LKPGKNVLQFRVKDENDEIHSAVVNIWRLPQDTPLAISDFDGTITRFELKVLWYYNGF